jgi:hypothetical protein
MGKEMMNMAGFVPKNKLSKKAQKELDRQRRVTWDFSPVTKTVDSKKVYNRKRNARDRYDDYGTSVFHQNHELRLARKGQAFFISGAEFFRSALFRFRSDSLRCLQGRRQPFFLFFLYFPMNRG